MLELVKVIKNDYDTQFLMLKQPFQICNYQQNSYSVAHSSCEPGHGTRWYGSEQSGCNINSNINTDFM